jgi:hypothetical protein
MARLSGTMLSRKSALAWVAVSLSGCALAPETKTFYLSRQDWTGTELSRRGKMTVADSVAGAAPNTITILEIGALETAGSDPLERIRIQEERARNLTAALERRSVAPANIAVEARATDAPAPLWPSPIPMIVVVRY